MLKICQRWMFVAILMIAPIVFLFKHKFSDIDKNEIHLNLLKEPTEQKITEINCDVNVNLYPDSENDNSDRILKQLEYLPCQYNQSKIFKMLIWGGVSNWGGIKPKIGNEVFIREECNLQNCEIISDFSRADLVIFRNGENPPSNTKKAPGQLWMTYILESPLNVAVLFNRIDWTATYRRDSTIVAPYGAWTSYQEPHEGHVYPEIDLSTKTKNVAWFVSNCNAKNNRLEYAKKLKEHIDVDVYGSCGDKKCSKSSGGDCLDMMAKEYRFYLAFENSDCADYVTEKFWGNGLKHDVIPIVMGASLEEFSHVAPPGSFIHVDQFESPEEMAKFLLELSRNQTEYRKYFQWRNQGDFLKTKFFCRVCAMLNFAHGSSHSHPQVEWNKWWSGSGVCRNHELIGQDETLDY